MGKIRFYPIPKFSSPRLQFYSHHSILSKLIDFACCCAFPQLTCAVDMSATYFLEEAFLAAPEGQEEEADSVSELWRPRRRGKN